jgi:hypothetical protein
MIPFYTDNGPTLEAHNRQLLEAARTDNVDLLSEIFAKHGEYDVNFQDGWVLSPVSSICSCVANEGLFSIGNTGAQDT